MMFTYAYTNKSMNACSASADRAEAASACAETRSTSAQSANTIALALDTVVVSIFVAVIAIAIISLLGILGLIRLAALIILAAGFIPKFASLLTTIPSCVLGGATVSVFAMIAMTGIKLITKEKLTARNTSVVGLAVALGIGVIQANGCLALFPDWARTIFGESAVVIATMLCSTCSGRFTL